MTTKILLIILILLVVLCPIVGAQSNYSDPVFPIVPLGMCMDGVYQLGMIYTGQVVKYAYSESPSPGHVWIFLNGDPIDSYYGRVDRTYNWMFPDETFDTYQELKDYIHERTSRSV